MPLASTWTNQPCNLKCSILPGQPKNTRFIVQTKLNWIKVILEIVLQQGHQPINVTTFNKFIYILWQTMGKVGLWVTTKVSRTFTLSTKLFHCRKSSSVVPTKTVMTLGVTNADEWHIWVEHNWIDFSLKFSFYLNPLFCNCKNPDSSRMNWICMWVSLRRYVDRARSFLHLSGASRTTVPFGKTVGALNSVSKSDSDVRWAGVLWFMYPRMRIAIGRHCTLCVNRHGRISSAPSGANLPDQCGPCPWPE